MPMRLDADNSPERDFWDDLAEMAHVCEFKRVWDGVLHERINGCYEFKCQCGKSEFRQAVARGDTPGARGDYVGASDA